VSVCFYDAVKTGHSDSRDFFLAALARACNEGCARPSGREAAGLLADTPYAVVRRQDNLK
jgi:hypothetical protein